MRGLKGKTAIVTGGAAGIGAAIVERFKAEGTKVVVFDLKGAPSVDITDYAAVQKAVEAAGPVDILVNNAGWDMFKPFLKTDPAFLAEDHRHQSRRSMNLLHTVLPAWWRAAAARWSILRRTQDAWAPRARRPIPPARAASSR